jgi:cytochrome b
MKTDRLWLQVSLVAWALAASLLVLLLWHQEGGRLDLLLGMAPFLVMSVVAFMATSVYPPGSMGY